MDTDRDRNHDRWIMDNIGKCGTCVFNSKKGCTYESFFHEDEREEYGTDFGCEEYRMVQGIRI